MRIGRFFAAMSVASAFSLLRGFVLAGLLEPTEFGAYAILVAVGVFASNLLGFGRIEATRKNFSRLWLVGQAKQVLQDSDRLASTLAFRALVVALTLCIALVGIAETEWLPYAIGSVAIALSAALVSVYASTVRASNELHGLARATLLRSSLALPLVVVAGLVGYWPAAVAAEVTAASVGAWVARREAGRLVDDSDGQNIPSNSNAPPEYDHGGRWLFFAFLAASAPLYLDRLFVAAQYGFQEAGQYAFLMLFVSAAVAVTGIVEQKAGPQQVRMQREGSSLRPQVNLALRWMTFQGITVAVALLCATWAFEFGPLRFIGQRYELNLGLLAATTMLSVLQSSVLLDWLLISRDGERFVLVAAVIYLVAVCACCLLTSIAALPITIFIFILAVAKLLHLAALIFLVSRVRNPMNAG
jgi:hypothetical protein